MANLQDIARELNLSVSLVSKVLNNRLGTAGASEATRKLIHRKARQMGYRKHVSAAALASGKQNIIGVFIHRQGVAGSGINEAMVEGVSEEASRHSQRLILEFFTTDDDFRKLASTVDRNVVDGLIVAGVAHDQLQDELISMQRQRKLPVVTIHRKNAGTELLNIGVDQCRLISLATSHLIEKGCRRIVHLAFEDVRTAGYLHALEQYSMPVDPVLIYVARNYLHEAGSEAVADLVNQGVEFDGLVGQSDQHAIGAINELLRSGRRVPEDVAVVGVDNSPFCDFNVVPLTSVSEESSRRGQLAVRLLMDLLNDRDVASVQVQPVLYERRSSQRPNGIDRTAGNGSVDEQAQVVQTVS